MRAFFTARCKRVWPVGRGRTPRLAGLMAGLLALLVGVAWLVSQPRPLLAQDQPTSTPDAEGNIYVVVQQDDSFWSIAARAGLTLQELLELNGMEETAVLRPGDLLLIGRGTPPATPTSDVPTATLPPPTPTPTGEPVRTALCMLAFADANRDGKHDPQEALWADVAFTVFNESTVIANYITDGVSEPYCLDGLQAGTYHITRSVAPDEVLTTEGDWALSLVEGSVLNLAFGSYQPGAGEGLATPDAEAQLQTRVAPTGTPTPEGGTQAPARARWREPAIMVLLGIGFTALLLAIAVLLFWFARGRPREDEV